MIEDVRTVAKAMLMSPAAIFISKIELPKNGPPDVHGGAVVNLGQQAPEIAKALERIELSWSVPRSPRRRRLAPYAVGAE